MRYLLDSLFLPFIFISPLFGAPSLDRATTLFEKGIEQALDQWGIPGAAVAVVKDGKTLFIKGYGYRNVEKKELVTPSTLFQIGSISKSFTSTLTALFVEENKLDWKDPVRKYLPDFTLYDPWVSAEFSIEDLLTHRSGLPEKTGNMQALVGLTPNEIEYNLRFIKPTSSFRTKCSYQNIFYVTAGKVLEKITNSSFADLLQNRLCTPLGMNQTMFSVQKYLKEKNRSSFYTYSEKGALYIPDKLPCLQAIEQFLPAGGIHSNVEDLVRWMNFQLRVDEEKASSLLSAKQMAQLRRPQIFSKYIGKKPCYYGMGWAITQIAPRPFVWHGGETFGARSILAFIPKERLGIVILTNLRKTKAPEALVWDFFDAYYGKKDRNWTKVFFEEQKQENQKYRPATLFTNAPLDKYVGNYQSEVFGKVKVLKKEQHLVLFMGPHEMPFFLHMQQQDRFSMHSPIVGTQQNGVQFHRNKKGEIIGMSLALFEEESFTSFSKLMENSSSLFGYL